MAQLKVIRLFHSFLSREEDDSFSLVVTMREIEAALKYFKKDKSPGPDGWPVEFFLVFFDLLGRDLQTIVECSRIEGRVSPYLNYTFLAFYT